MTTKHEHTFRTALELLHDFRTSVTLDQMDNQDYKDCYQLLKDAADQAQSEGSIEPFFAQDKGIQHLVSYCLNCNIPLVTKN